MDVDGKSWPKKEPKLTDAQQELPVTIRWRNVGGNRGMLVVPTVPWKVVSH